MSSDISIPKPKVLHCKGLTIQRWLCIRAWHWHITS